MGSKNRRSKAQPPGNTAFGLFVRRMGRLLVTSLAKSASDSSSTPAAPWFALTRLEASHTIRLEIVNGFAVCTGSSHRWLTSSIGQKVGPLRSARVARLHHYYGPIRPFASHRYSAPHGSTAWSSLFASRQKVPTFRTRACAVLTPSSCRSPRERSTGFPRICPEPTTGARFR